MDADMRILVHLYLLCDTVACTGYVISSYQVSVCSKVANAVRTRFQYRHGGRPNLPAVLFPMQNNDSHTLSGKAAGLLYLLYFR